MAFLLGFWPPSFLSLAVGDGFCCVGVCSGKTPSGEGLADLVRTIAGVIGGDIATSPKPPAPPQEAQSLVDELVSAMRALYPGLRNPRWIAYRLIEGDYRIRQALKSGELAAIGHNDKGALSQRSLPSVPA